MDFSHTAKVEALVRRVTAFMQAHVHPNETTWANQMADAPDRFETPPIVDELKRKARSAGLWNLFLHGTQDGLTNLEYAPLAEIMGRVHWASEVFNCSAPDTGNMETLAACGTPAQREEWLVPLLAGEIRSAFSMTEPDVASSDATNIRTRIRRDGEEYVIDGHKWFSSGAGNSRCRLLIVMGKTDPDNPDVHRQQSMILVPRDAAGVRIVRQAGLFGYDDAPGGHAEVRYDGVRVPAANVLLGEGRGFEVAQRRLGPGRIHHCMRNVGQAEVAFEKMCRRLTSRTAFGRAIGDQTVWQARVADARIMIDQARLLVLHAADRLDQLGSKGARKEIGMIKIACPAMLNQVVDWAIQAHGAAGVGDDFGLGYAYARARAMRIVDGPDEVHRNQVGKLELARYRAPRRA